MRTDIFKAPVALFVFAVSLASCEDYFEVESKDQLFTEDYISNQTEMYAGMMGILRKVQEVGDKQILLTDTRAEMLEPTDQSTAELIAIYNYDDDLQGNSYANPSGYYSVVISCNDYLQKMREFKEHSPERITDKEVYRQLISSTLRIKVWAYKTIAEIYGEAIWFDSPIHKLENLADSVHFERLGLEQTMDKCLGLILDGYDGIPANLDVDWIAWLDPTNITNEEGSSYRQWNFTIPPVEGLLAELCLWKGAFLDRAGVDATRYYRMAADTLLHGLNRFISDQNYQGYWLPCAYTKGRYERYWDNSTPRPEETVAAISYSYEDGQTNTLISHFSADAPAKYLLRPSVAGMNRFTDNALNPGASLDNRTSIVFSLSGGKSYLTKFRPLSGGHRPQAHQEDVPIYIYRATQYHMMLCEALNHLQRFKAADALLNNGVNMVYVPGAPEWKGFNADWTSNASWGTRTYPHMGIRGAFSLTPRTFYTILDSQTTSEHAIRSNDMAILDEWLLEFSSEGKNYPAMIRHAHRYGDFSIIADRIAPKYGSRKDEIKNKILSGAYFVKYDLNIN